MANISVEAATSGRFADAQHALSGGGEGAACQCQWWMLPNKEWNSTSAAERADMFRAQAAEALPPGLVVYVDGEAAGWVRVSPRDPQLRIPRTREIIAGTAEPFDDPSVWSVSCFVVRKEFRGQGLGRRLLAAAIDHARSNGARVLEGYPLDPTAAKKSSNQLFRGNLHTFLDAGFSIIDRPKPDRALVSLTLKEST